MAFTSDTGRHLRVDSVTQGIYTTEKPRRFYFQADLVDGVWSDSVLIPKTSIHSISYDLDTTGTAIVQCTLSPIEDIEAGTAIWRDIPENVEINPSIMAIRGRSTGASGTFTVVAV